MIVMLKPVICNVRLVTLPKLPKTAIAEVCSLIAVSSVGDNSFNRTDNPATPMK
jgi:hypothetical protein